MVLRTAGGRGGWAAALLDPAKPEGVYVRVTRMQQVNGAVMWHPKWVASAVLAANRAAMAVAAAGA
jgi:hypothetical protein